MLDYQLRVVAEKEALDTKLDALELFTDSPTYAELDIVERSALMQQLGAMHIYSRILGQRIQRFSA